ncbi:MAG: DUF354 domain-containing protein, partial [Candidatus Hodarchaeota archaeon]
GLKENVYIEAFEPDSNILDELNIDPQKIIITLRPPATDAHYHNPESETLFEAVLEFLGGHPKTRMVILPRTQKQGASLKKTYSNWFASRKIIIPNHVVNGLNLIWHSDLVASGGGTMNREAAALGVPVYSIFRGDTGAVDRYLSDSGRLTLIETAEDVPKKIVLKPRQRPTRLKHANTDALQTIVEQIVRIFNS